MSNFSEAHNDYLDPDLHGDIKDDNIMKLEIKKVIPETVMLWHDEYGFIGEANEYEFNLFRVDIKENELDGYYVLKGKNKYYINSDATLNHWDFFKLTDITLSKLLGL